MTLRPFLIWSMGAAVLAYTPSAPEILSKMSKGLRRTDAVEARVVRERPDGEVLEEALLTIPGRPGNMKGQQDVLDLPYSLATLPLEEFLQMFPTMVSEDTSVTLGRLDGTVCYILEGRDERFWLSKADLIPQKIEILSGKRLGTLYLYLDIVKLSGKVHYPSRTEVWRGDELILVERLLPAQASTQGP